MKVRQWAWLLLAGAVAPFVFDNGPDPVSDGLYRVVDDHGRIGYADAYASFASRPDLPLVCLLRTALPG